MLFLWAALSPLSPQYMYETLPLAVQRVIFDAADFDAEPPRANTLWALTMDETTRVAPSNIIHRFFTSSSLCWLFAACCSFMSCL
jgi:hypothetical protein